MKIISLLLPLAFGPFAFAASQYPELDRILGYNAIGAIELSPDGRRVAFSRRSEADDGAGPDVSVLNVSDRSSQAVVAGSSPKWAPDSKTLAYVAAGGKGRQVFVVTPPGAPRQVTRQPSGILQYAWSPDGRTIAYTAMAPSRRQPGRPIRAGVDDISYRELWMADVATGRARKLAGGTYSVGGFDQWFVDTFSWSPDSGQIAFSRRPDAGAGSHLDADIAVVDVRTQVVRTVVERPGMDVYPIWSPDGRSLAFVTTEGRRDWVTGSTVDVVELSTGKISRVSGDFDEKIKEIYWTDDGRFIFFPASQGTSAQIFRIDVASRTTRQFSRGQALISDLSLARDGSLAFLQEAADSPPDIYLTGSEDFQPRPLTHSKDEPNPLPRIKTQVVRWKSFDGMPIEGVLQLPLRSGPGKRLPLLVNLHGGPHGAEHDRFKGENGLAEGRWLANLGWAVFRPNFRGSSGYGERFLRANLMGWGIGDYQDVMTGVDELIAQGIADPERLAVTGESYGGYLSAWIISQTTRFKAAIIGCAIVDLPSFIRTSDVPDRFESYLGSDARAYPRHSPSTFIDRATTPTLIWHGDADPRVPPMQSRFLYTALLKQKVPVELVIYPGMGHGITGAARIRDLAVRRYEWLQKYVPGEDLSAAPGTPPPAVKAEAKPALLP